jgi:hypothetical protein
LRLKESMEIQNPLETCDGADFGRLLFSRREVAGYENPFFHGCIDNYLPAQVYRSLLGTFPEQTLKINYDSKITLDGNAPGLDDFWRASPFCKTLLGFFTSTTFLNDIKKFILPAIARDRGATARAEWHYVNGWSARPGTREGTPIRVTFKFSRLTSNGWMTTPH